MIVSPETGRRLVENCERWVNDLLMELVCCTNPISRDCLLDMLEEIADLRFGVPPTRPRGHGFYSGPLFWEPFGCGGTIQYGNVSYRMDRLKRGIDAPNWIDHPAGKMAQALYDFHVAFSRGCEDGELDRAAIDVLVYAFEKTLQ